MYITADIIKTALLSYYRFKKFHTCTDEAICYIENETCDVLVDKMNTFHDIEVKISKSDLLKNETKKMKHKVYRDINDNIDVPNQFSICVPTHLLKEAERFIKSTNKNYGLIEFNADKFKEILESDCISRIVETITIVKPAKLLHSNYSLKLKGLLYKRLCSAYCNIRQKLLDKVE